MVRATRKYCWSTAGLDAERNLSNLPMYFQKLAMLLSVLMRPRMANRRAKRR